MHFSSTFKDPSALNFSLARNKAYLKMDDVVPSDKMSDIIFIDDEEHYGVYYKYKIITDDKYQPGLYLDQAETIHNIETPRILFLKTEDVDKFIEQQTVPDKMMVAIKYCQENPENCPKILLDEETVRKSIQNELTDYPISESNKNYFSFKHLESQAIIKCKISFPEVSYYQLVNNEGERIAFLTKNLLEKVKINLDFSDIIEKDVDLFKQVKMPSLFKQELNFEEMGIGGLDDECKNIFKRIFASRSCNPDLRRNLDIIHCRGLLFHGPPGCGKTLIARELSKIVDSHEPLIVNGPELFNKWIGKSEEALRTLFKPAKAEWKEKGEASQLHVIIFDEIDALFARREAEPSGGGKCMNNMVNQLLSLMDGVESMDNILVIGMTNRLDILDPAILRPGRFEIQIKISLPDYEGRKQIFKIHSKKMSENGCLDSDVDLDKLARMTENYTGAEIASLVRSAAAQGLDQHLAECREDSAKYQQDTLKISAEHFELALEDMKPQFQKTNKAFENVLPRDLIFDQSHGIKEFIDQSTRLIDQYLKGNSNKPLKLAYFDSQSNSGKTTLVSKIAQECLVGQSNYFGNMELIGLSEMRKSMALKDHYDQSLETETSLIILDDLEKITEFGKYFNTVQLNRSILQTIKTLFSSSLPKKKKIVFLTTYSDKTFAKETDISSLFDGDFQIPLFREKNRARSEPIKSETTKSETTKPHNPLHEALSNVLS